MRVLLGYFRENWIASLIITYFIFSALLKLISDIDVCIPCIWKSLFDVHCPGCGLTTAFIALLRLDVRAAYEANFMIFIILPAVIFFVVRDFYTFYLKQIQTK